MFERDDSGQVTAMKWQDRGTVYTLPRATATPDDALDVTSLARYAGRYTVPEAGHDVEVVIHEGGLAINVPGTGLVELEDPDKEGFFRVRVNPSLRIRFDEGPDGEVVSFTVYAPDGSTFARPRITEREKPSEAELREPPGLSPVNPDQNYPVEHPEFEQLESSPDVGGLDPMRRSGARTTAWRT
jgi:hypothetical protein